MKKGVKILIIVLVLLVFGLICYIIYDKVISKKSVKKEIQVTETKKVNSKENLNSISDNLLNFISENRLDAIDAYGMDNLPLVAIDKLCYGKSDCNTIDGSLVKQYIKTVFNKDTVLQDVECFNQDGVLYKYNSNTNTFNYNTNHLGHGGINYDSVYSKVYSIKKVSDSNNKYILIVNKLFYSSMDDTYIRSSINGTSKVMDLTDDISINDNGLLDVDKAKLKAKYDANYDQYKEIGPKYEYTFVKRSNGTYYLEKYEVIGW